MRGRCPLGRTGQRGVPGSPEGRVVRAEAHLVLQDADVALQKTGPDGERRLVLVPFRRATGHRRHLLLLLPPRLRVATAAADAAVHEQQAGAHGGERQADGQPVALRGAEREAAQRRGAAAPPAAGPAGRSIPRRRTRGARKFHATRDPAKVRGETRGTPSFLLLAPRRSAPLPSSLSPSPASLPLLPSSCPVPPRLSFPCSRSPLGTLFVHFNECWGLWRSPLAQLPTASSFKQLSFLYAH